MSTVRIRAPDGEAWGLTEGEPVVAEILDHNLDVVNRVALETGSEQLIEVPVGSYVVRVRLPNDVALIARASSTAEEGPSAASKLLRTVAHWLKPRAVALDERPSGPADSIRQGLSDALSKIADSSVTKPDSVTLPPIPPALVEPSTKLPKVLYGSRIGLWTRDGGDWTRADSGNIEPLGDGRFRLTLYGHRMVALQLGGPSLPWRTTLLPPADLEVRVAPAPSQSQLDVGVGVTVVLRNPGAEATLRYMELGATQDARLVAESAAEELLRTKQLDVTAAVVGGYCLLRTGGYERLHDWPNNLADWYPWLPDSAVIHAWQLLDEPGAPNFMVARDRLLQAERAGIPIFSDGLKRLYDGLILFRDDPDTPDLADVNGAVKRLDSYMASASLQPSYTTYYGPSPSQPSLDTVIGEIQGGVDVRA